MTKNSGAKPKGPRQLNSQQTKKTTRSRRRKRMAIMAGASSNSPAVNSYLLSLLNPKICHSVGIPDQVTLPSIKVQTQHRTQIIVRHIGSSVQSASSWEVYCWSPTLQGNTLRPGGNADGSALNLVATSAASAATNLYKPAGLSSEVLSAAEIALIKSSEFSALRCVSMEVEVEPSASLLNIAGEHGMALWSGQQWPAPIDNATTSTGGFSSILTGLNAPTNIDSVMDNLEEVVPLTRPVRCVWTPEDVSDLVYQTTNPNGIAGQEAEWFTTAFTNGTLSETTTYAMPIVPFVAPDLAGNYFTRPTSLDSYPFIVWACNGVPTATKDLAVGFATITVNWELLPGIISRNFGTTRSPSNPDEVTQATNLLSAIPKATSDSPESPNQAIQEAASKTATHLYDGTSRKSALEGTSITKVIGGVAGLAAPALALVPGVGGALAVGASLLSAILG